MRTAITRLLRRRPPEPTGRTRLILPTTLTGACAHYGYPAAEGVDWNELSAHFKVRRAVGEPV
jgi:hypothetical protein